MTASLLKPAEGMGVHFSRGKIVVHAFLALYAVTLFYIILGLIFNYYIQAEIFFGLSIELLLFALVQAFYELGLRRTLLFVVVASVIGFLSEVLGTSTGIPFGLYSYGELLGAKVLGVPVVVPFAWFVICFVALSMMRGSFPAFGQRKHGLLFTAALVAFGVMAWDLLIDPMFSSPSYGYWTWAAVQPIASPRFSGVPVTNFLGWFVIAFLILSIFLYLERKEQRVLKRENKIDSYLVYVLLMIDGAVANYSLGHPLIIAVGVACMLAFTLIALFFESKTTEKKRAANFKSPQAKQPLS